MFIIHSLIKQTPIDSLVWAPGPGNPVVNKRGSLCLEAYILFLWENTIISQFTNDSLRRTKCRLCQKTLSLKTLEAEAALFPNCEHQEGEVAIPSLRLKNLQTPCEGGSPHTTNKTPAFPMRTPDSKVPDPLWGSHHPHLRVTTILTSNVDYSGSYTFPQNQLRNILGYTWNTVRSFNVLCRKYPESGAKSWVLIPVLVLSN